MADGDIGAIQKVFLAIVRFGRTQNYAVDTNVYQRTIWAIANLPKKGNSITEIIPQANKIQIAASDVDLSEQTVREALKRLVSTAKRQILVQPIPGIYGFSSPLMKGFVRLVRYRP
jgi:allophanate hydrolase subunit 1